MVLDELGPGTSPASWPSTRSTCWLPACAAASMPAGERAVFVSAATGEGIEPLLERVGTLLRDQMVAVDAVVPYSRGELVARAKVAGHVAERFTDERDPPPRAPAPARSPPRSNAPSRKLDGRRRPTSRR